MQINKDQVDAGKTEILPQINTVAGTWEKNEEVEVVCIPQ
ncbi:hypothetical protein CCHR01_13878 [Colletotrichum chrysophilum]|uniref:Uncharacterized protein n=1 Tax=Colletotrichum chrysophilum TaxID=1836956 RepID=A0AAD9EG35_9PEZI|nr:hypothetical protein CCHR01_13878 [Colletotrichum chrysophilum]